MTENGLKPCPFCGKQPEIKIGYIHDSEWFWVQCVASEDEEGCANVMSEMGDDYTVAVLDWNTRPIEDALNARIEELEAENKQLKCYCGRVRRERDRYEHQIRQHKSWGKLLY